MTEFRRDTLKAAGYRCFPQAGLISLNHADALWQKRVRDDADRHTLYFIDIWEYQPRRSGEPWGWQPETHFYLDEYRSQQLQMTLVGYTEIEAVEEFVALAYDRLSAYPYDRVE